MKCPYCLLNTDLNRVTDEHIIPRQLGRFSSGRPVTIKVCSTCNMRFCRELENSLAIDSWEAITRFRRNEAGGLRPKQIPYNRITLRADDQGPYNGAHVYYTLESGRAVVQLVPQVGLPIHNVWEWIPLRQLEQMETNCLVGRYDSTSVIQVLEDQDGKVRRELERLGVSFKLKGQLDPPPDRPWIEQRFYIDHRHRRLVSKIAFNYLTAVAGIGVVQDRAFDTARAYIKLDMRPSRDVVAIVNGVYRIYDANDVSWANRHVLSVGIADTDLVGFVQLYRDIVYRVVLARCYRFNQTMLPSAHEYCLRTRRVTRVDPADVVMDGCNSVLASFFH